MTVRMGYVPQRSIAMTAKSTSVPTGRKRREDIRAGTTFGQNGTQKSWVKFKPCEISEKPLFLWCHLYQRVMHSTAYRVWHRMKAFVISQKAALNSEKGYCPLWTEHRYGNSERKVNSLFLSQSTVRHLLFNKQIIPYHEQKRMEEM